jgi:class 3 adenylate cyclase
LIFGRQAIVIGSTRVPIYLDRHDLTGLTAADVAEAHRKDLSLQDAYGVRFLTYWFDEPRGAAFCLVDAPSIETAMQVHHEAHGAVAGHVIEVELSAVEAFLGRIADPRPAAHNHRPAFDGAFRAVLFTDIVDSTGMTSRLGDVRAVEMVRAHDAMVRRALAACGGREVKHTGDGIMAAFDDVTAAAACGCRIQRAFAAFNQRSREPLKVRIGIHAGEPVEDSNDLFGATVQVAARICQEAAADSIVVSETVRGLLADVLRLDEIGPHHLKGFTPAIGLYEIAWR